MSQVDPKAKRNSSLEMLIMLICFMVAASAICVHVLRRGSTTLPSRASPQVTRTAQQLPKHEDITEFGKPLKQLTIWQKQQQADATQQAFAMIPNNIEGFNATLAQGAKECLVAARQHLPRAYTAYVVWLDSEIILLLAPTTRPLTTDQISAFEGVFRLLQVPIAEDRNNYRRFTAVRGRFKGVHGVAIPLRKDAPKKPAA